MNELASSTKDIKLGNCQSFLLGETGKGGGGASKEWALQKRVKTIGMGVVCLQVAHSSSWRDHTRDGGVFDRRDY